MYITTVPKWYRMLRDPQMTLQFYITNFMKFAVDKVTKRNVFLDAAKRSGRAVGRPFISNEEFNSALKERLSSDDPLFCCRYGATEITSCFYAWIRNQKILDEISEPNLKKAKTSSGIFPKKEDVYLKFADAYMQALENADLNAYWGSVLMEEYMIGKTMRKDCVQYAMRALEPFPYDEPWTMALEGRDVLIVHPFDELIERQYQRRKEIFPEKEILPDCNLKVVKAIQSSGETVPQEYTDWSAALDALYNRCMEQDFDVALLACGSYAVPLAARMKQAGKKAIVLGGMMQLLFGIKGARWELSRPDIVALYNDFWVRATEYKVKDADKMTDGPAYW